MEKELSFRRRHEGELDDGAHTEEECWRKQYSPHCKKIVCADDLPALQRGENGEDDLFVCFATFLM